MNFLKIQVLAVVLAISQVHASPPDKFIVRCDPATEQKVAADVTIQVLALGLAISQVFTSPADKIRTQFDPATEQKVVADILTLGCEAVTKELKLDNKQEGLDGLFQLFVSAADEAQLRKAGNDFRAPPKLTPQGNKKLTAEKIQAELDVNVLQEAYRGYCKKEVIENSGIALDKVITYYNKTLENLPDPATLKNKRLEEVTKILSLDGSDYSELYTNDNRRNWVPIALIPKKIQDAFVAAEDKNFWSHKGIDAKGLLRAFSEAFKSKKNLQGGSTITQQVVKNLLTGDSICFDRKLAEIILAARLENVLTKAEILELYLNLVYLGRSSWGVARAAKSYFNKPLRELTLAQAATLAVMTRNPLFYSPDTNAEKLKDRREDVLSNMFDPGGMITEAEALAAGEENVIPTTATRVNRNGGFYFMDEVKREAREKLQLDLPGEASYVVRTTQHPKFQQVAEWSLQQALNGYEDRVGRVPDLTPDGSIADLVEKAKVPWQKAMSSVTPRLVNTKWQSAVVLDFPEAPGSTKENPIFSMTVGLADGQQLSFPRIASRTYALLKKYDLVYVLPKNDKGTPDLRQAAYTPEGSLATLYENGLSITSFPFDSQTGTYWGQITSLPDTRWRLAAVTAIKGSAINIELSDGRKGTIKSVASDIIRNLRRYDLVFVDQDPDLNAANAPFEIRTRTQVQGAVMVMEAKTGRILAMVGGNSYFQSRLNRATRSYRPPGSTLKPFVYLSALQLGFQPNTLISNACFNNSTALPSIERGGQEYAPGNYNGKCGGQVSMRYGLEQSLNIPAIRMMSVMGERPTDGLDYINTLTQTLGIYEKPMRMYPFALGQQPARMVDMVKAYATIANIGLQPTPTTIESVEKDGEVIYQRPRTRDLDKQNLKSFEPDIDRVSFYQLRHILEGTLVRGTAKKMKDLAGFIAGKTGTSSDFKDAWFIGFTNDLVIAAWVGHDNNNIRPNLGTKGGTGGSLALPIAEEIFRRSFKFYKDKEPLQGAPPEVASQIVIENVDFRNGNIVRNGIPEFFRRKDENHFIDTQYQIVGALNPAEADSAPYDTADNGIADNSDAANNPAEDQVAMDLGDLLPDGANRPSEEDGYLPGVTDQQAMWQRRGRYVDPNLNQESFF